MHSFILKFSDFYILFFKFIQFSKLPARQIVNLFKIYVDNCCRFFYTLINFIAKIVQIR